MILQTKWLPNEAGFMSNSKMAAKIEDGGRKTGLSQLKRLILPISTTMQNN